MIGIYKITNPKGKIYIGQSRDIKKRFYFYKLYKAKEQPMLYKSFIKYGFDNHKFEIIEECTIELLNELEIHYIKQYNSTNNMIGLNLYHGGFSMPTDETKFNMSISHQKLHNDKTNEKYKIEKGKTLIAIRLSYECFLAYKILQMKNINPARLLREGGEQLVIKTAEKYKLNSRVKKIKLPF